MISVLVMFTHKETTAAFLLLFLHHHSGGSGGGGGGDGGGGVGGKGLLGGYCATFIWACAHPSTPSGDLRSQVAMVLVQLLQ